MKEKRFQWIFLAIILLLWPSCFSLLAQNSKPNVIPSIREWRGGSGSFTLKRSSRICVDPDYLSQLITSAHAFRQDLFDAFGTRLNVVSTTHLYSGDILLTLSNNDPGIGDEGYLMDISNSITIKANAARGAFYGTRSVIQILAQSPGNDTILKGTARDYPEYPSRGFMIDVGRMPITMSWLRDYVKFMSYYKMGDFHIHLNDNDFKGPGGYANFRLESTTYPGLSSTDLVYTKKEYSDLHTLAKTYGVSIISEFDTPAHSGAFTRYRPDLKHPTLAWDHLDLGNPDIYTFMDALWDEYATIFDKVHIGTDEYNNGGAQDMKDYMNYYNRYLKNKGLGPVRMWGSQGTIGGAGGVDRDMLVNIWYGGYYNPIDAINDGYDVINTADGWYIVPMAGYYNDYLNIENVYNNYNVWEMSGGTVAKNHPQLKGGSFCVWNDVWSTKRYTEVGVHDRARGPMKAFSQKMWAGKTELPYPDFANLMDLLGDGPGVTIPILEPDPPKPGNLAGSKRAVSSSNETGNLSASQVVDNKMSTRWASHYTDGEWIYVDLGKNHTINHVELYWETAYGSQYHIQISTDATNWTTVFTESAGNGGTDKIHFSDVSARYVRMQGVKRATSWGYSLYEFEVYGKRPKNLSILKKIYQNVLLSCLGFA